MKCYLASPLFSYGDRIVNEIIAKEVRNRIEDIELYSPMENGEINDKNAYASSIDIAKADTEELMSSDALISVIDGNSIDEGVCAEIGMFYTTGKPIFALYTDIRQHGREHPKKLQALMDDPTESQWMYRNLFVVGLIKQTDGGIYDSIIPMINDINKLMNTKENN
jgi:nucleoside 2-deoxyribosyltransferase